nr:MAG TPA: hypothetical protein [Caudoviricetes sp.]
MFLGVYLKLGINIPKIRYKLYLKLGNYKIEYI